MGEGKLFNLTKAPVPVTVPPQETPISPPAEGKKLFNLSNPPETPSQSDQQVVATASETGKPFGELITATTNTDAAAAAEKIRTQQLREADLRAGKIDVNDMTAGESAVYGLKNLK